MPPKKTEIDAPNVTTLPPTLVLIHIAAGIALNWIFPVAIWHSWGWLGLILLAAAFAVTKWSKDIFQKAGTNVAPNKPATAIVQNGPYQYSRNPMYVCMIVGFFGLALLAGGLMMLLVVIPLFVILDRKIIAPEETYLTEKFGEEYKNYKVKVRRWL